MSNWNLVLGWALARLMEPTTWLGVSAGSTAVAVALGNHTPLYIAIIGGIGAMVAAEKKS